MAIFTEDETGSTAGSGTKLALGASVEAPIPIFMKDRTGKPGPAMMTTTTRRAPECGGEDRENKKSLTRTRPGAPDPRAWRHAQGGKTDDISGVL
jgi:hypothetical protein